MKRLGHLLIAFVLAAGATAHADTGIQTLPELVSTTSPASAITQRVYGKPLKLTGFTSLLPICIGSNGLATTTGCSGASGDNAWVMNGGALTPTTTVGVIVSASSTIGGGTQTTGLTISGGATTTGNAYFAGGWIGIASTTPTTFVNANTQSALDVSGGPVYLNVGNNSNAMLIHRSNSSPGNTSISIRNCNFTSTCATGALWYFGVSQQGSFAIRYNANSLDTSPAFTIASSTKNVGIASSTPWANFSVVNAGSSPGFIVSNSGNTTAQLIVDSSGNVGISTTSPSSNFAVNGSVFVSGGATTTGQLSVKGAGTLANTTAIQAAGNILVDSTQQLGSASDGRARWTPIATGNNSLFNTLNDNVWQNNSVERMRLTLAGNLGVSTSTPWGKLAVSLNSGDTNTNAFIIASSTSNSTSTLLLVTATGSTTVAGPINVPSTATSTFDGGIKATCFSTDGTNCISGGGSGVTSVTGTYPIISSGGTTPAISIAFGTTTANTWSLLNIFSNATSTLFTCTTCWFTNASSTLNTATTLWSTTATITNASTTNLSASQSLYVGSNRVSGERYPVFSYATTTWTGSTTVTLIAPFAGTLNDMQCETSTGTLNTQMLVNSTNVSSMFNASTTKGTVTFTGSNTFVRGDTLKAQFGTPASSPTSITCTGRATGF